MLHVKCLLSLSFLSASIQDPGYQSFESFRGMKAGVFRSKGWQFPRSFPRKEKKCPVFLLDMSLFLCVSGSQFDDRLLTY